MNLNRYANFTRKVLYFSLCIIPILFFSCDPREVPGNLNGKKEKKIPRQEQNNKGNSGIVKETFDLLNLDYPGLESVKKYYEAGALSKASEALLEYYRKRVEIVNINVDKNNTKVTSEQKNIANQATRDEGYRFYVRNYAESNNGAGGLPKFWSFLKDGKIDWQLIPKGVKDREWKYQKHRLQWALTQAKVYYVTKDEKYVKAWIDIYGDWLKNFPAPNIWSKNTMEWAGLQSSLRLIDMLSIFEYYNNSTNFTPEWLTVFLKSVSDHAENIMSHPYKEENSNIRLSQYKSIFMVGVLMPEFQNAKKWLEYGAGGISASLSSQFNEDGVHNELDPSYHLGVVSDLINIYSLAKANDMMSYFPENFTSYLHKASRFIMDIVYPNYTIENYNDTRSSSSFTKNVVLRNLRSYSSLFPDDNDLLYTSTEGVKGNMPSTNLRIYDKSGYYMFRTGWQEESMMLVLKNNYNPDNKWHCQPDNGTIALYNKGRRFLPDAGVFTYGGSAEQDKLRNAFKSTSMHNTMTKECLTITNNHMKGQFLGSGFENGVEYIVTKNDSYDDLSHRRAIFFVDKSFFVIVDEGYGSGNNIVANISFNLCDKPKNVVIDSEYGNCEYGAHTIFKDGNNMLFKTFVDTKEGYKATNSTNYYSDKINKKVQRRFYRVGIKKTANLAARFITVIVPFGSPAKFKNMNISAKFTDNDMSSKGTFHKSGVTVQVEVNGKQYNLSYKLN